MSGDGPWWQAAFAAAYREVYAHRDDAAAEGEVAAISARLAAEDGPVLDAGCGCGRHLAALRRRGFAAVGIDWSVDLLGAAGRRGECRGAVARGDLRAPPFAERGFAAVLSLFTAFGYGEDDENAAQFARLARLLAPGGWFVLDLPDPDEVRRRLVSESVRTSADGVTIEERRAIADRRVEKRVRVRRGEVELASWRERVRLYEPAEIDALAAASGLGAVERWPGLRGPAAREGRIVAWLRGS